jgi:multidrug efflux pump subunit AcrB
MTIGEFSVRQPVLVNLVMIGVLLVGIFTFFSMPAEFMPNVSMDEAVVWVAYPGVAPEEIETLITKPLEEEIENVEDVEHVISLSSESRCVIDVRFKPGLSDDDFDKRILDLRSAVSAADARLPDDIRDPVVVPIKMGEVTPIMSISLGGPGSETQLREIAEDLREELLDLKHIADVDIIGEREREIRVELDAARLRAYGVPIGSVIASLSARNLNVPGGTLDAGDSEYIVRAIGEFKSLEDIANHVVLSDPYGRQIRIRDLGAVRDTLADNLTLARLNSERSVTLWVMKEDDGSVVEVAAEARDLVKEFDRRITEDVGFEIRNDTSTVVENSLAVLKRNAAFGILLVALTLFIFIGARNAVLACIGIPFSFFGAFILMNAVGMTINTLSLFSLVLVLGMLVDDAIIVIENIYRHMETGKSPREAAIIGVREVQAPVTAAVLTTVAAFLPLLLMSGTWGKFMAVIPKTVTFALLVSLIEALFILPSHMADFSRVSRKQNTYHPMFLTLTRKYEVALRRVLRRRYLAVLAIIVLAVISIGLATTLDIRLFEDEDLDQIEVRAQTKIGMRLEDTDVVARKLEAIAASLPADELEAVVTRVGFMIVNYRGELASNNTQISIDLVDSDSRRRSDIEIMDTLREEMSEIPGLTWLSLSRPVQGPPTGMPVEVRIKGDDLETLRAIAGQIRAKLAEFPGVVDIDDDAKPGKSELRVTVDQERASLYGLTVTDIASALRIALEGVEATKYRGGGGDEIGVVVRLREQDRVDMDDLKRLPIATNTGVTVPLSNVARLTIDKAQAELHRRDGERVVTVTAGVEENTTSTEVNRFLQQEFSDISVVYPGYRLDFGGEFQATQESFSSLLLAFLVAILLIYAILGTEFQSFIQPIVIMFTVPFAFIGVVIGLLVMRFPLTLTAGIAVVALAGVVVNDSIVLVDFIKNSRLRGVDRWESVVRAGCMRLRPILLTSITTIFGILPLAMGWGGSSESWGPMASSIAWGLAFATVLTLFVIPALYSIVDDVRAHFGKIRVSGGRQPDLRPHVAEELARLKGRALPAANADGQEKT